MLLFPLLAMNASSEFLLVDSEKTEKAWTKTSVVTRCNKQSHNLYENLLLWFSPGFIPELHMELFASSGRNRMISQMTLARVLMPCQEWSVLWQGAELVIELCKAWMPGWNIAGVCQNWFSPPTHPFLIFVSITLSAAQWEPGTSFSRAASSGECESWTGDLGIHSSKHPYVLSDRWGCRFLVRGIDSGWIDSEQC